MPEPVRIPLYGTLGAPSFRPSAGPRLGDVMAPAGSNLLASGWLSTGQGHGGTYAFAAIGAPTALIYARRGVHGFAWEPAPNPSEDSRG
jgi:hypothetical protein